jgi:hypothetical protein
VAIGSKSDDLTDSLLTVINQNREETLEETWPRFQSFIRRHFEEENWELEVF